MASNTPRLALITSGGLLVGSFVAYGMTKDTELLAVVIASTIPSLLAAGFSERVAKDIRNGVVQEKAREGAKQALHETGVTQAVEEGKQTTPAALTALIMLLSDRLELDAEERETIRKDIRNAGTESGTRHPTDSR